VKYDQFVTAVAGRAGVPPDEAEALTRACLRVLAERLSAGEAEDLRAQLPKELKDELVSPQDEAQAFGPREFARRVAEQAGTDEITARAAVAAVLSTLRDAVTPGEFDDVLAQLDNDFAALVDAGK
jgi:uncharacterized protein (DUF2267 family)